MSKRYSTLRAKLHELESILNDALLLGPDTQSHESLSKDIKQKIVFIRNLLAAEVASHPSKPHHLEHISQRLAALEKAFQQWDNFRTFSYEQFDRDSTCSCTESCFNDDAEVLDESGLDVFVDPEKDFPGFIGDKALVEFNGGKEEEFNGFDKMGSFVFEDAGEFFEDFAGDKELVEFDGGGGLLRRKRGLAEEEGKDIRKAGLWRESGERRESAFGKKCSAWAGGVVLGMVLMGFIMVKFSGCFRSMDQASFTFTVPT